jgi:pheromone alpha factor receptor
MSATTTAIPSPDPTSADWSIYIDNQSFNITGLDGTPTTLTFPEINVWALGLSRQTSVSSFTVGFVSMLFIVLLLVTPAAKIRKPIFVLNLVSMFLVALRNLLETIFNTSSYLGVGQYFLDGVFQYPLSTWTVNVLVGIVAVPGYATIMISLLLQVRVVFAAEPKTRNIFTVIGAIAIIVQTGFLMTWLVFTCQCALNNCTAVAQNLWIYNTFRIFFCSYVGVACLVFLYKLGFTIYRRRKMGMNIKQFGPLQIIFVMFCQCLVVPLLFYILDLTVTESSFQNFDSLGQVFLVVTLPLSTLWASADARDHGPVKPTLGSDGSSSGHHSRNKYVFWSRDKKSKDDLSDVEKAPSYITDGTHTNENVQLHPTSFDSTLEDPNR